MFVIPLYKDRAVPLVKSQSSFQCHYSISYARRLPSPLAKKLTRYVQGHFSRTGRRRLLAGATAIVPSKDGLPASREKATATTTKHATLNTAAPPTQHYQNDVIGCRAPNTSKRYRLRVNRCHQRPPFPKSNFCKFVSKYGGVPLKEREMFTPCKKYVKRVKEKKTIFLAFIL